MCDCKEIRLQDVGYKNKVSNLISYHNECGEWLSESQVKIMNKERMKLWG